MTANSCRTLNWFLETRSKPCFSSPFCYSYACRGDTSRAFLSYTLESLLSVARSARALLRQRLLRAGASWPHGVQLGGWEFFPLTPNDAHSRCPAPQCGGTADTLITAPPGKWQSSAFTFCHVSPCHWYEAWYRCTGRHTYFEKIVLRGLVKLLIVTRRKTTEKICSKNKENNSIYV